ncbi:uncharacterized protein LOC115988842 [Quercus lobata]|uniref:uncharacterized protein LOC115988842 n=1 Tax=Quercus lobata TaxID=97700 RepID=UPI001246FAF2|nr:uncharacterized protein LOC115988842 [Quercus lobata]
MHWWYTLDQFKAFHNIDIKIYKRLVIDLRLDPNQSKKVVAFWNCLERIGYANFVSVIQPLPDELLRELANETITCLILLDQGCQFYDVDKDLPLMLSLTKPAFSFWFFYQNRQKVISKINAFVTNVCDVAFSDIVPPQPVQSLQLQIGFIQPHQFSNRHEGFPSYTVLEAPSVSVPPNSTNSVRHLLPPATSSARPSPLVPSFHAKDRTLFVTFSKGHHVSKGELQDYITRRYGDCIESIYMKAQPEMGPPQFANVFLRSSSDIERILGGKETVDFLVNGKQVRGRLSGTKKQ